MARHAPARRAMTLLELIAIVFILGLLGTMAATRFGSSAIADVGAQGFARRVALDCLQARRAAISTGDNHLLRFTFSGSQATQYVVCRRQAGLVVPIDQPHDVPTGVDVTTAGATDVEFTFTGEALTSYAITATAPDRTKTVVVAQSTGKAFVQ